MADETQVGSLSCWDKLTWAWIDPYLKSAQAKIKRLEDLQQKEDGTKKDKTLEDRPLPKLRSCRDDALLYAKAMHVENSKLDAKKSFAWIFFKVFWKEFGNILVMDLLIWALSFLLITSVISGHIETIRSVADDSNLLWFRGLTAQQEGTLCLIVSLILQLIYALLNDVYLQNYMERVRVRIELGITYFFYTETLRNGARVGNRVETKNTKTESDKSGKTVAVIKKTGGKDDSESTGETSQTDGPTPVYAVIGDNLTDMTNWAMQCAHCLKLPIAVPIGLWVLSEKIARVETNNMGITGSPWLLMWQTLVVFLLFEAVWISLDVLLYGIKKKYLAAWNDFSNAAVDYLKSSKNIRMFGAWNSIYFSKIVSPKMDKIVKTRRSYFFLFRFFQFLDDPMAEIMRLTLFLTIGYKMGIDGFGQAFTLSLIMSDLTKNLMGIEESVYYFLKFLPSFNQAKRYFNELQANSTTVNGNCSSCTSVSNGNGVDSPTSMKSDLVADDTSSTIYNDPACYPQRYYSYTRGDSKKEAISKNRATISEESRLGFLAPLELHRGDVCLLEGQVGAGKTMCLLAILDELAVHESGIEGGGAKTLMSPVAYVPEASYVLEKSILENILFGLPYNEDIYFKAIYLSELQEEIFGKEGGGVNPLSSDLVLTNRGENVSGGQRQRIGIARALYKVLYSRDVLKLPDILLIMDNPLSALDGNTARIVWEGIKNEFFVEEEHQPQIDIKPVSPFIPTGKVTFFGTVPSSGETTDLMKAGATRRFQLDTQSDGVRLVSEMPLVVSGKLMIGAEDEESLGSHLKQPEMVLDASEEDASLQNIGVNPGAISTEDGVTPPGEAVASLAQVKMDAQPGKSFSAISAELIVNSSPAKSPAKLPAPLKLPPLPSQKSKKTDPILQRPQVLEANVQSEESSQNSIDAGSTFKTFSLLYKRMGAPLLILYICSFTVEMIFMSLIVVWYDFFQVRATPHSSSRLAGNVFSKFGVVMNNLQSNSNPPPSKNTKDVDTLFYGAMIILGIAFIFRLARYMAEVAANYRAVHSVSQNFLKSVWIVKGFDFLDHTPASRIINRTCQDCGANMPESIFLNGPLRIIDICLALSIPLFVPILGNLSSWWQQFVAAVAICILILAMYFVLIKIFRVLIKDLEKQYLAQKSRVCEEFAPICEREGGILLRAYRRNTLTKSSVSLSCGNQVLREEDLLATVFYDRSVLMASPAAMLNGQQEAELDSLLLTARATLERFNEIKFAQIGCKFWLAMRLDLSIQTGIFLVKLIACLTSDAALPFLDVAFSQVNKIFNPATAAKYALLDLDQQTVCVERLLEWTDDNLPADASHENGSDNVQNNIHLNDLEDLNSEIDSMERLHPQSIARDEKPDENESILSVRGIACGYSGTRGEELILKNVNLEITRGERLLVVGRTGSGKSTFFSSLLRLIRLARGEVVYKKRSKTRPGTTISHIVNCHGVDHEGRKIDEEGKRLVLRKNTGDGGAHAVRRDSAAAMDETFALLEEGRLENSFSLPVLSEHLLRRVFRVFPQTPFVFKGNFFFNCDISETIDQNVILGLLKKFFRGLVEDAWASSSANTRRRFSDDQSTSEEKSEIPTSFYRWFFSSHDADAVLSAAQKQILHACRVLAQPVIPEIVLLDEVTARLPEKEGNELMEILEEVFREQTLLCITHQKGLQCFQSGDEDKKRGDDTGAAAQQVDIITQNQAATQQAGMKKQWRTVELSNGFMSG